MMYLAVDLRVKDRYDSIPAGRTDGCSLFTPLYGLCQAHKLFEAVQAISGEQFYEGMIQKYINSAKYLS